MKLNSFLENQKYRIYSQQNSCAITRFLICGKWLFLIPFPLYSKNNDYIRPMQQSGAGWEFYTANSYGGRKNQWDGKINEKWDKN